MAWIVQVKIVVRMYEFVDVSVAELEAVIVCFRWLIGLESNPAQRRSAGKERTIIEANFEQSF